MFSLQMIIYTSLRTYEDKKRFLLTLAQGGERQLAFTTIVVILMDESPTRRKITTDIVTNMVCNGHSTSLISFLLVSRRDPTTYPTIRMILDDQNLAALFLKDLETYYNDNYYKDGERIYDLLDAISITNTRGSTMATSLLKRLRWKCWNRYIYYSIARSIFDIVLYPMKRHKLFTYVLFFFLHTTLILIYCDPGAYLSILIIVTFLSVIVYYAFELLPSMIDWYLPRFLSLRWLRRQSTWFRFFMFAFAIAMIFSLSDNKSEDL